MVAQKLQFLQSFDLKVDLFVTFFTKFKIFYDISIKILLFFLPFLAEDFCNFLGQNLVQPNAIFH